MRRVAALVLPHLACELARAKGEARLREASAGGISREAAFAAILEPESAEPLLGARAIDVVDDAARRFGVRPGMQVTEASAMVAGLIVARVTFTELEIALGRVAELALPFAPLASLRIEEDEEVPPLDTIWLDVTGAAHLVGGEEALAHELAARAASLGHRARCAIADGPRLAQALARHAPAHVKVPLTAPGKGAEALAPLPIRALPLDPETVGWFLRLGLVTIADLAKVPRPALAARLAARASLVIDLLSGRDDAPLVRFSPPRVLVEATSFEEGIEGTEPLLFVMRGMVSRLSARLEARGEACSRLEIELTLDRSISALRGAEPRVELAIDLPAPLAASSDLLRALKARLERVEIAAPVVSLRLVIPAVARARRVQLDLSRGTAANPDALPALLAELSAEIGASSVGVLASIDAHVPEKRSALVRVELVTMGRRAVPNPAAALPRLDVTAFVTRLLPVPIPLGEIGMQRVVAIDQALFSATPRRFSFRLEEIGWWTRTPISRDYLTAWFSSGEGSPSKREPAVMGEGLVYVDRRSGAGYLQGWIE